MRTSRHGDLYSRRERKNVDNNQHIHDRREGLCASWPPLEPCREPVLDKAPAALSVRHHREAWVERRPRLLLLQLAREERPPVKRRNPAQSTDQLVEVVGARDPAPVVRAEMSVYRRAGLDPVLLPRNAGSYPGYVFTGDPLKLPAAHFGLGHGSGAHAPDEYFVIESSNPKVRGWDGAVRSFADYLYELAVVA